MVHRTPIAPISRTKYARTGIFDSGILHVRVSRLDHRRSPLGHRRQAQTLRSALGRRTAERKEKDELWKSCGAVRCVRWLGFGVEYK